MTTFVKIDEKSAAVIIATVAVVAALVLAPDATMGVVSGVLGGAIDVLEGIRSGVTG